MLRISSTIFLLLMLVFSSLSADEHYRTCKACEWLEKIALHNEKQLNYFEEEIESCRASLKQIIDKYESVENLRSQGEQVKNQHLEAMELLLDAQKEYDSLYNLLYPQEKKWLHLETVKAKELKLRKAREEIEEYLKIEERCRFLIDKFQNDIAKLRMLVDQDKEKLAECSEEHCQAAEELDLPGFDIPPEIQTTRAYDVINDFNEQLVKIKIAPPYMSTCAACRELGISLSKVEADVKNDQAFKEAFEKKLKEIQAKYESFSALKELLADARTKYQEVESKLKEHAEIFDATIDEDAKSSKIYPDFMADRKNIDKMRATVSDLEADYLLVIYCRTRLVQIEKEFPQKISARDGMREQFDSCRESNCRRRSGIPNGPLRYPLPRGIDVPFDPINGGKSIQKDFNLRFEQAKEQELKRRQSLEEEQRRREEERQQMQQRDLFKPTESFFPGQQQRQ